MTSKANTVSVAAACVAPHLACLRWCGFCRLSPAARPLLRQAHFAYCIFVLTIFIMYLVQECIFAYQERADMEKLSRVMFLLVCHLTTICKQVVFYTDAALIDALVGTFNEPLWNQRSARAMRALRATRRNARWLQRGYPGTALFTCLLWLVDPVMRFRAEQPVEFPFYVPIDTQHPAKFACVLLYSFYVTAMVGVANTTMDAFISAVLYQCTTQIIILRMNLENLCEKSKELSKSSGEDYNTVLKNLFREHLVHYEQISMTKSLLQDIFRTALLIQFTFGGLILCMAVYTMVTKNVLSVEFASIALFIVCILTELYVYCYYGNEMTYESARLMDSLYACKWEARMQGAGGAWFPRALLLAGERARRPLRVNATGLVPLSLETYLKILKSSYSFYAVLRQTYNKG